MAWKIVNICLLLLSLLILVLLAETFSLITRMGNAKKIPDKNIYKQCSWLKQIPLHFSCEDNWNKDYRIISAKDNKQSIILEIASPYVDYKKTNCTHKIEISLPYNPSVSGITIPFYCFDKNGNYYFSQWDQDGFTFRLSGKNISRSLFLDNLSKVGWSSR